MPSGRHVVLDLNGFKIDRGLTSAPPDGYVISVQGDLTITGNGTITGGYNFGNGGGVCVDGGTFTMESGKIIGNTADGDGGGVYVVKGATFTMEGDSRINGNKSGYNGGGVYVSKGTFTMKDGTIGGTGDDKNTATFGSGVYVGDGSTFTMSGGKISENVANNNGGGVLLETYGGKITFTMSGNSKIYKNTALSGGGVYMAGYDDKIEFTATTAPCWRKAPLRMTNDAQRCHPERSVSGVVP